LKKLSLKQQYIYITMKRKKTITIFTRSSPLSQCLNDQPSHHPRPPPPPPPSSRIGARHEWHANASPNPEMTLKMNTIIKAGYQILESKSKE